MGNHRTKISLLDEGYQPEPESSNHCFLNIGDIITTTKPITITTILGTCVSVCLWDPVLKHGSMSHFALPRVLRTTVPSDRFGEIAIHNQISGLLALGSKRYSLRAKLYGGGSVTCHNNNHFNTGMENIELARTMLEKEGIVVVDANAGGIVGRRIWFNIEDGSVSIKTHKAQARAKCPHYDPGSNSCAACGRQRKAWDAGAG